MQVKFYSTIIFMNQRSRNVTPTFILKQFSLIIPDDVGCVLTYSADIFRYDMLL